MIRRLKIVNSIVSIGISVLAGGAAVLALLTVDNVPDDRVLPFFLWIGILAAVAWGSYRIGGAIDYLLGNLEHKMAMKKDRNAGLIRGRKIKAYGQK